VLAGCAAALPSCGAAGVADGSLLLVAGVDLHATPAMRIAAAKMISGAPRR
jgi:Na+/serine symporter